MKSFNWIKGIMKVNCGLFYYGIFDYNENMGI